jgi:hypothetical protein
MIFSGWAAAGLAAAGVFASGVSSERTRVGAAIIAAANIRGVVTVRIFIGTGASTLTGICQPSARLILWKEMRIEISLNRVN